MVYIPIRSQSFYRFKLQKYKNYPNFEDKIGIKKIPAHSPCADNYSQHADNQNIMPNSIENTTEGEVKGYVVTIGRQFGCGGHEIGREIADALGISYYDKTLLSKAAETLGFDKGLFDAVDEKRPSWLRSLLSMSYGVESASAEFSDIDNEGLYRIQSRVIHDIAHRSPCVIVGRTASYILRDHPGLLSIFLHAPLETRVANIIARKDADTPEAAAALAKKMDHAREAYYSYYTNRSWGLASSYNLSLDTSRFSTSDIISIVSNALHKKISR